MSEEKIQSRIQIKVDTTGEELNDEDKEWLQIQTNHLNKELINRMERRRAYYWQRFTYFCNHGYFW